MEMKVGSVSIHDSVCLFNAVWSVVFIRCVCSSASCQCLSSAAVTADRTSSPTPWSPTQVRKSSSDQQMHILQHDHQLFSSSFLSSVLTEHQLFDVFNNAIVSFYRSEDEGGGEDGGGGGGAGGGGGGGNTGTDISSRNDRGSSSGGGAVNSDSGTGTSGGGGGTGDGGESGNTNNSPASNGGVGPGALTGGTTTNDALLFHEKCGTLIKLSNNNKTAERRRPLDEFNNGVVMTNRPLRHNEMFEVDTVTPRHEKNENQSAPEEI